MTRCTTPRDGPGHRDTQPRGLLAGVVLAGLLAGALRADDGTPAFLKYTITGEKAGDMYGTSVDSMRDVNDDGVRDLIIGVPEIGAGPDHRGKVIVASGADGSTIRSWRAEDQSYKFYGQVVACAGDVDKDGYDDVLASNPDLIEKRSGRTGELLAVVYSDGWNAGGVPIKSVGDLDGDDIPEFAVGDPAPSHSDRGAIKVYSGWNGLRMWMREGEEDGTGFGFPFHVLDDLDGDGARDLAVCEVGWSSKLEIPGTLHILSGRDGATIRTLTEGVPGDYFGYSATLISDLDGDGVRELAVGVPEFPVRGMERAGRIDAISLVTGERFWRQTGESWRRRGFGGYTVDIGDADGDDVRDLLVKSGTWSPPDLDWAQVSLCSGRTGDIVATYVAERDHSHYGASMVHLGDIDGDGSVEFAVGAPEFSWGGGPLLAVRDIGRIYVMSYLPERQRYIRGDADTDGDVDITDAVVVLEHLIDGSDVACPEALDVDRNHAVSTVDALGILRYRFAAGPSPEEPFPACGRLETLRGEMPCERSFCE